MSGKEATRGKSARKVSTRELRRRQRIVRDILRLRKYFEKLPLTAEEAYRISRKELERRP